MTYRRPRQKAPWLQLQPPPPVNDQFLLKDLEEPVETFTTDAAIASTNTVQLRDVKPIASYSWIEGTMPTIAVPGYPRMWRNITVKSVPADSGVHFVDRNASHMGYRSPLTPIFAAVDTFQNNFQYNDLDFITDRNNLRKLLRCIDNQTERAFRIDVDLMGKTCVLTRREEFMMETVNEFRGYGHEYEQAATKPHRGSEDELGHHRIVSYNFGGLKVLLRCTVDACAESGSEDDDFLTSFSALNIGGQREAPDPPKDSPSIIRFGIKVKLTFPRSLVPQSALIEIKTRAAHRELDWKEVYPQLYLSQTGYLYFAKHTRGTFGAVEKIQVSGRAMAPHRRETEVGMGKLKVLLEAILKVVRERPGVPLSLVYREGALKLYMRKDGTGKPIAEEVARKFRATIR